MISPTARRMTAPAIGSYRVRRQAPGRWVVQQRRLERAGGQIVSGWTFEEEFPTWELAMAHALGQPDYRRHPVIRVEHATVWAPLGGGAAYRCTQVWPGGTPCDTRGAMAWVGDRCARYVPAHLVSKS